MVALTIQNVNLRQINEKKQWHRVTIEYYQRYLKRKGL